MGESPRLCGMTRQISFQATYGSLPFHELQHVRVRYIRPPITLARSPKRVASAPSAPTVDGPATALEDNVVSKEQAMFCQTRNTHDYKVTWSRDAIRESQALYMIDISASTGPANFQLRMTSYLVSSPSHLSSTD